VFEYLPLLENALSKKMLILKILLGGTVKINGVWRVKPVCFAVSFQFGSTKNLLCWRAGSK